jgi:hypothetical protein
LESATALAIELWNKAMERLERCEFPVLGDKVLELAIRFGCSSFDAEFVVLAKELKEPLGNEPQKSA